METQGDARRDPGGRQAGDPERAGGVGGGDVDAGQAAVVVDAVGQVAAGGVEGALGVVAQQGAAVLAGDAGPGADVGELPVLGVAQQLPAGDGPVATVGATPGPALAGALLPQAHDGGRAADGGGAEDRDLAAVVVLGPGAGQLDHVPLLRDAVLHPVALVDQDQAHGAPRQLGGGPGPGEAADDSPHLHGVDLQAVPAGGLLPQRRDVLQHGDEPLARELADERLGGADVHDGDRGAVVQAVTDQVEDQLRLAHLRAHDADHGTGRRVGEGAIDRQGVGDPSRPPRARLRAPGGQDAGCVGPLGGVPGRGGHQDLRRHR